MTQRVEILEGQVLRLEVERAELITSLGGMQGRVDEAFNEQVSRDSR